jgi:hypothetical protein
MKAVSAVLGLSTLGDMAAEDPGFNCALADAFANVIGFFEGGEREPGASAFTDGIRIEVAELFGAKWTQMNPGWRQTFANMPKLWPSVKDAWPTFTEQRRQEFRDAFREMLEFYRQAHQAHQARPVSYPSPKELANQRSIQMMEEQTAIMQRRLEEARRWH